MKIFITSLLELFFPDYVMGYVLLGMNLIKYWNKAFTLKSKIEQAVKRTLRLSERFGETMGGAVDTVIERK